MFGKKKKEPKVEKVFDKSNKDDTSKPQEEQDIKKDDNISEISNSDLDEFKSDEEESLNDNLTEEQRLKTEKLNSVREKISKILKSSNIEIVDENFGDEFESEAGGDSEKQQQDYDSLKALFGSKDKSKTQELTLTIDDFDYTYIGQYVDEYDLMHVKGIKKIRLQKKHSKHLKKVIIAACALVVVGIGGFLGYYFTRETPVYLKGVTLNQTEHDYYIYENFDYTGLYFIAEYSNGTTSKIPLSADYLTDIIGRVERNGNDVQFTGGTVAELTFQYSGFPVSYTVNLKSKTMQGLTAIYADGLFELKSGDCINDDYLKVLINYGDVGKEFIGLNVSGLKVIVDRVEYSYSTSIGGFKLTSDITKTSTITIKYLNFELSFSYIKGVNMVN